MKYMKKSDIKDYMIVETGFEDGRYIVMGNSIVDDELTKISYIRKKNRTAYQKYMSR